MSQFIGFLMVHVILNDTLPLAWIWLGIMRLSFQHQAEEESHYQAMDKWLMPLLGRWVICPCSRNLWRQSSVRRTHKRHRSRLAQCLCRWGSTRRILRTLVTDWDAHKWSFIFLHWKFNQISMCIVSHQSKCDMRPLMCIYPSHFLERSKWSHSLHQQDPIGTDKHSYYDTFLPISRMMKIPITIGSPVLYCIRDAARIKQVAKQTIDLLLPP